MPRRPSATRRPMPSGGCRSRAGRSPAGCGRAVPARQCGHRAPGRARTPGTRSSTRPWRRCRHTPRANRRPRCPGRRSSRPLGTRSAPGSRTSVSGPPGRSARGSGSVAAAGRDAAPARRATARAWRVACHRSRRRDPGRERGPSRAAARRPRRSRRCSTYGCWIELQTATPSSSGAATKPCGSIAKWVVAAAVYRFSITRSATTASTSPQPKSHASRTFVSRCGSFAALSSGSRTRGDAGSSASRTDSTAGSG